jgi:hypothetical protein
MLLLLEEVVLNVGKVLEPEAQRPLLLPAPQLMRGRSGERLWSGKWRSEASEGGRSEEDDDESWTERVKKRRRLARRRWCWSLCLCKRLGRCQHTGSTGETLHDPGNVPTKSNP